MSALCTDGTGQPQVHPADGWLLSPDGIRITEMCRAHADGVIAEYREALGEEWGFAPHGADETKDGGGW